MKVIVTFASINNGKDYVEAEDSSFIGEFGIYEDVEEGIKHELMRKAEKGQDKY